ncbi:MAG: phosphoribosylformimino-5-aminoimidazole carboxamide ribotide isomerase [Saprospiraceae bacterium]|jgi:phosphoribosylformimino-5-aminoimidazole carboxamide ribotide isomerase
MRLIPAIDIIGGKCVRLSQGDYDQKKEYDQSPIEIARELEKTGYEYLHLVDLDGAKSSQPHNLYVLNQIALETNLKIDFGGGIKSEDSLIQALRSGAHQINIGSLAVRNPNLVKFWLLRYSPEQIVIGADVKDGKIALNGWREVSDIDLMEFINDFADAGAKYFVCTDISKDGMMQGSSVELYDRIMEDFPDIKLIASGGVSSIEEIKQLESIGVDGAIIGKAIYEGLIDLVELRKAFS